MANGSTSGGPSRDADPLIHWRLVEMAEQQPGLIGDPAWWSVMVELRDTSLSQFLKETEHANGEPLDAILLVPPLYQAQAAQHSRRRIVTLYATQQFQIGRAHVELQSLMRISYPVLCLKKKKKKQ